MDGEPKAFLPGHASQVGTADLEGFGFSHLVLEVSDLDRSEAWYRDVAGLEVIGRNVLSETAPHSVLRMNTGQLLVLLEVDTPVPQRPNSGAIHHAFWLTMDQYHEAQERYAAAGYDTSDERAAFRSKGEYSMDAWDPDGHHWQIQSEGPEAQELIKPGVGVVECGPVEQFPVGSVTSFGAGNFFLVHAEEGFLALSRWCRHRNGILAHQPEHWRFFCNFHGATYNYCGDHTGHMRDVPPLRMNPVTVGDDGIVRVDTDVVVERDEDEAPPYAVAPLAAAGQHFPARREDG
ncbi:MAG TPA: VOC family protein [Chloroflexota bacterium]|nr:VOC family protein [Chloroflexota bacterium]